MPLFRLEKDTIKEVPKTSFRELGLSERYDLQRLLRDDISIVAPGCLVVSEEFGSWEDSKRRIDLLAIDKQANLVVIELKRTDDGGHMDLQAIRYAAMVSTFSFSDVVEIYGNYLQKRELDEDPSKNLLNFLGWSEPDEDSFGDRVRIVLASADFSKELTNSVLWLSDDGDIDISCVRIRPHGSKDEVFIDVQQIIPLPEAQDYQVRRKEKKQIERRQKRHYDYTNYDVVCDGQLHEGLNKRQTMLQIVKFLAAKGHGPQELNEHLSQQKPKGRLPFYDENGLRDSEVMERLMQIGGVDSSRYFTKDDYLIEFDGNTYAISNQWGKSNFDLVTQYLVDQFSSVGFSLKESSQ